MTIANKKRRISVDIPEEDYLETLKFFQWGDKNKIYKWFTKELLRLFKRFGYGQVIGACLTRSIKLEQLTKLELKEAENGNKETALGKSQKL